MKKTFENDPYVAPEILSAANLKHDLEMGDVQSCWDKKIRSSWRAETGIKGKKLTDRMIDKYAKQGRYSETYREALRELIAAKKSGKKVSVPTSNGNLVWRA